MPPKPASPMLAHVVHALQQAVLRMSPTATVPMARRNDAPMQTRQQAPGAPEAPWQAPLQAPPVAPAQPAAQPTAKPAAASAP